jgi:PKD repeat protein
MRFFSIVFLLLPLFVNAQHTYRVLFLGNSYTAYNNLPQLVKDVAISTGDTIIFDSNTPGGFTLQGHSTNTTSLQKIISGNWDVVVLQEQSQLPSFPINQVITGVFPYAQKLDSIIHVYQPCGKTMFYMTWGRKNGDASNCATWPPVCTYQGMDSLLYERYMMMAQDNDAVVSPVGAVWKYIRNNFPGIELYSADESHPSLAGSYAAACSFYSSITEKDPTQITFNGGLTSIEASSIRSAVKAIVFDSLSHWNFLNNNPSADFNYSITGNTVDFNNTSNNATSYLWNFGDNNFSTNENPNHTYTAAGNYSVTLIIDYCGLSDTVSQNIFIGEITGLEIEGAANKINLYPLPVKEELNIQSNDAVLEVKLYDVHGRILNEEKGNNITSISTKNLNSGIYIFMIKTELGISKYKIVKS